MECKYTHNSYNNLHCLRINRYIMECKYKYIGRKAKVSKRELIDTLWNVNKGMMYKR